MDVLPKNTTSPPLRSQALISNLKYINLHAYPLRRSLRPQLDSRPSL